MNKSSDKLAKATKAVYDEVRKVVTFNEKDRIMSVDIEAVDKLIVDGNIIKAAESAVGTLEV